MTNYQTNTYFINCILIGLVFCLRWTCPKRQIADNKAANGYSTCALHHLLNGGLLWYSSRNHFHGIQSLLPRLQVSFMHSLIKEQDRCFTRVGRHPYVNYIGISWLRTITHTQEPMTLVIDSWHTSIQNGFENSVDLRKSYGGRFLNGF